MYRVHKEITSKRRHKAARFRGVTVPDWLQEIHAIEQARETARHKHHVGLLDDLEGVEPDIENGEAVDEA